MRVFALALVLVTGSAFAQDDDDSGGIARATRVAVSNFDSSGVDERITRVFTNSLLAELRKLQRVSVIGMDEVQAMLDLEAQKQLIGCEDDSCLAEIAGALGADVLIIGGLANLAGESILDVKRIDQRQAKVTGTVNQRLVPAEGEEFLAAIGPAIEQLFFDHPLREGEERGVSKELALRLNPPPLPPWALYSAAGTAGGLAFTSLVVAGVWGAFQADYNDTVSGAAGGEIQGSILKGKENTVRAAESLMWTGAVLTVVAGGTAAAMVPFTDWTE